MNWTRLLFSRTVLGLRWFNVGVFLPRKSKILPDVVFPSVIKMFVYHIFSSPCSPFLNAKERDFPSDIFLPQRNHGQLFFFLQSPPSPILLKTASASCNFNIFVYIFHRPQACCSIRASSLIRRHTARWSVNVTTKVSTPKSWPMCFHVNYTGSVRAAPWEV